MIKIAVCDHTVIEIATFDHNVIKKNGIFDHDVIEIATFDHNVIEIATLEHNAMEVAVRTCLLHRFCPGCGTAKANRAEQSPCCGYSCAPLRHPAVSSETSHCVL